MRLCAHIRCYLVSANTFEETGFRGTYLTPDGMLVDIAYATKRKHKCSVPPLEILPISIAGQYRNAFLANAFFLSKANAKLQTILYSTKFFCQSNNYLRFVMVIKLMAIKLNFLIAFSCNSNILYIFVPIWSSTPNRYEVCVIE